MFLNNHIVSSVFTVFSLGPSVLVRDIGISTHLLILPLVTVLLIWLGLDPHSTQVEELMVTTLRWVRRQEVRANVSKPLLLPQHLHNASVAPRIFDTRPISVRCICTHCRLMRKLLSRLVTISAVYYEMFPRGHIGSLTARVSAEADRVVTDGLGGAGSYAAVRTPVLRCDVRILVFLVRCCTILSHHVETLLRSRKVSFPSIGGLLVVPISQITLPIYCMSAARGDTVKVMEHVNGPCEVLILPKGVRRGMISSIHVNVLLVLSFTNL